MTESAFVQKLKVRQGTRSQRALALELKISPAYLCDIFLGRRPPGPTLLKQFGLKRVVTLVPIERKR